MDLDLSYINYKNYKIDLHKLNIILQHVYELANFLERFDMVLAGSFPLIFLSKKIYRTPTDIDILIKPSKAKDIKKIFHFLSHEWEKESGALEVLETCKNLKLIKYASDAVEKCSQEENTATLYKIDNSPKTYNYFIINNFAYSDKINEVIPKYVYHNPQETNFEITKKTFKLNFHTNYLLPNWYKSFIIFYDDKLKYKKLIECKIYKHVDKKESYWSSPDLNIEEYNNCFYRIFTYRFAYITTFFNKKTLIKLDCYSNNDITLFFDCSVLKISEIEESSIEYSFHDKKIQLNHPFNCLNNKYNRPKDLDDYEIYKYLLDQYPLTNS